MNAGFIHFEISLAERFSIPLETNTYYCKIRGKDREKIPCYIMNIKRKKSAKKYMKTSSEI